MAKEEIQDTSDYKLGKDGRKVRAHKIVFNKGEEDGTKLREACMTNKKKSYKSFVKEALKGDQHKLDKNKNGKVDKQDFKLLRKEESIIDESWDDMLSNAKKTAAAIVKTSTATKHDVKKTSTGTVYTKQRDSDGNSKEFKRDNDQTKRGRGRPKKNSFSEAAEFLMSLDEEMFDSLMEDGFDAFVEHYEQLDELSKSTLSSYVKKAADDRADTGYHSGYWDRAHGGSKPEYKSQAEKEDGQEKRKAGIHKALHRLTK